MMWSAITAGFNEALLQYFDEVLLYKYHDLDSSIIHLVGKDLLRRVVPVGTHFQVSTTLQGCPENEQCERHLLVVRLMNKSVTSCRIMTFAANSRIFRRLQN